MTALIPNRSGKPSGTGGDGGRPKVTGPSASRIRRTTNAVSGSIGVSGPPEPAPGYSGLVRSIIARHDGASGSQG